MRRRRRRYEVSDTVSRALRRRRWTRRGVVAAVILVALSTLLDRFGVFNYRGDDWGDFDRKPVAVTAVVDGDTIRVRRSPLAADESVRLLGIDAPEMSSRDYGGDRGGGPPEHWGSQASDRLRQLVGRGNVTLRLDAPQTRDKYGRLLAYVYAGDVENVNLALVREGHVYAHRSFPHSLRRQFEQAEDEARAKQRGLWADVKEDQMPQWRRRWLAEVRSRKQWDP